MAETHAGCRTFLDRLIGATSRGAHAGLREHLPCLYARKMTMHSFRSSTCDCADIRARRQSTRIGWPLDLACGCLLQHHHHPDEWRLATEDDKRRDAAVLALNGRSGVWLVPWQRPLAAATGHGARPSTKVQDGVSAITGRGRAEHLDETRKRHRSRILRQSAISPQQGGRRVPELARGPPQAGQLSPVRPRRVFRMRSLAWVSAEDHFLLKSLAFEDESTIVQDSHVQCLGRQRAHHQRRNG